MAYYKAILESSYYGADEEYEFEAPDNATEEEINEIAYEVIKSILQWHWEKSEEESEG